VRRDLALAAAGLALAFACWRAADGLQRSFLADAVGADGVPKALAAMLALLSAWIAMRALRRREHGAAGHGHLKALGLAGLGFAYLGLVSLAGYPVALALLIAAAALFYGAPATPRTALFAAGSALALWLVFARLLGVAMPGGLLY